MNLAYAVFDRTIATHFHGHRHEQENENEDSVMYHGITAEGEADPAIRIFARKKLAKGNTVFIMSADASLLLGLDPQLEVFAIGMDSLALSAVENEGLAQ